MMGVMQAQAAIINAGGFVTPSRTKTRHFDVIMPSGARHYDVSENDLVHLAESL